MTPSPVRPLLSKGLVVSLTLLLALPVQPVALAQASQPMSGTSPSPYYSSTYSTQRNTLASYMESEYNSTYQLIQGTILCGNQLNSFDIIDANFLSGPALAPYDPSMSASIASSSNHYLSLVNYQHNDRREVLFGNSITLPPLLTDNVAIIGVVPTCPNGGKNNTGFFISTELPNTTLPKANFANAMNTLVPAVLEDYMSGNNATALSLFSTALSWWTYNSTYHGFLSPTQTPCIPPHTKNCSTDGSFNTRDLDYFLFMARATRFPVPAAVIAQIEDTLWTQQSPAVGGGMATSYNYDGSALTSHVHTSNEANALTLLAYDPRIQTTWFKGAVQALDTHGSASCSPGSLIEGVSTTCTFQVSNSDETVPLLPVGSVNFTATANGGVSTKTCVLSQENTTAEGCSVSFTPGPGSAGTMSVNATYSGDGYHFGTTAATTAKVGLRASSVSVSCTPNPVPVSSTSLCKAQVVDSDAGTPSAPTGDVTFSAPWGTLSNPTCTLSAGSCSLGVTPTSGSEGTRPISASYQGDQDHSGSTWSGSIEVAQRSTTLKLVCSPSSINVGTKVTCTVTVTDSTGSGAPIAPHGTVTFSSSKKGRLNLLSCTLVQSACQVTFKPGSNAVGTIVVSATYSGDTDHQGSSGHFTVVVK